MKQNEHNLQVACVKWFRLQYPEYSDLLFAIPNGGQRHKVVAAKLKAEGVVPGVPDLFLAVFKNDRIKDFETDSGIPKVHSIPRCGMFIEMKVKPNKTTEKQKTMMAKLMVQGYQCEVCYSFDQFREIIINYLK